MANKILLIEDEDVLRDILLKGIRREGFDVSVAVDGEDGLRQIQEKKPDLVLLDMILPKMDGWEVLKRIKDRGIKVPVIIISNSGQPVDIKKALKLGARDYLVKANFGPAEILQKINLYLTAAKQSSSCARPGAKRILIIEDDKFLRDLCIKGLDQLGFCVDSALDGTGGLKKIIDDKPDLVLLDIVMPDIGGFEILKRIRTHKDKAIAKIPIIVLSNLGQDDNVRKGLELGADDYLIKADFTVDGIAKKIKKYFK